MQRMCSLTMVFTRGMNNGGRADVVEVPLHGHKTVVYGNNASMYEYTVEGVLCS